jgi:hypothetical protein
VKNESNTKALMAALEANAETTRDIVASATAMMDDVTAAMRRRAAESTKSHTRRPRSAMPPPVASLLNSFSRMLADKIGAINTRLPDEVRDRLRAVAPGFVRAVLENDPDVVQLFSMLLAATPDEAAHWLVEQVDLLEQRFAS